LRCFRAPYIPLGLEIFKISKLPRNRLISQQRLILPQRSLADLSILCFRHSIFQKGLFELIKCYDNAEEFGEGFLEVALGTGVGELDFLHLAVSYGYTQWMECKRRYTSSRFMLAERLVLGT